MQHYLHIISTSFKIYMHKKTSNTKVLEVLDPELNSGLKKGNDLLSHPGAVPSALIGLTSLFGMGRGETYRYNHLKVLVMSFEL